MITKTAIALAILLAAVTGSTAATKMGSASSGWDVYTSGGYAGTDPDANIRHSLRRDNGQGD